MALRVVSSGTGFERRRRLAAAAVVALMRFTLATLLWLCVSADAGRAQPVPGEVSVALDNGFARLLFRFGSAVNASARLANNIVVVSFDKPVNVSVDRLNTSAPSYISAARLDPDGMAVRIALAQQVKANLISANERVFLDLLPRSWTGLLPGLPQDVVEELARRTREAERRARTQQQLERSKKLDPIRVRAADQPTFTRYTIPLPNIVAVSSDRDQNGLTLAFDAVLPFDLADALVALPPFVASIESKLDGDASLMRFTFNGKVDVRTFREDNNYVVDVSATDMSRAGEDPIRKAIEELRQARSAAAAGASAMPEQAAPETVPAAPAAAAATPLAPPSMPALAARQEPAAPAAPTVPARAATPPAPAPPAPAAAAADPAPGASAPPPSAPSADRPNTTAAPTMPSTPAPAAPAAASRGPAEAGKDVKAQVRRSEKSWRIVFPFATPTPAAVFRRADVMWLVFDTEVPINVDALREQPNGMIRQVSVSYADGQVIRLKLDRPRLSSLAIDANGWAVTLGDTVSEASIPINLNRTVVGPSRAGIAIPFEDASRLHRIADPDVGDVLLVVSALGPVRGVLKSYEFVELNALASTHGIAIQPLADDVMMQIARDRVIIGRPDGLALSAQGAGGHKDRDSRALFDIERWGQDRGGDFNVDQLKHINAAVDAPADQRSTAYRNLARLYMAREMFHEAKGALDMALSMEHVKGEESGMYAMHAVALLMIGRPKEALKDLAHPSIGNQHDAPLWRAMAYALDGKWPEAREGFQAAQVSIGMLPIEMQRLVLQMSVQAAIEAGDVDGAASQLNDFETIGAPPEQQPAIAVLRGRIAEKLGRTSDAIAAYQTAVDSNDPRAAAQARLRLVLLRMSKEDIKRADAVAEIETVSVIWRGDRTEIEALQALARLYTEDGRLREAFGVMRVALTANARSEVTRSIQDEAAATFESLFLSGKGETLPAIDALSLFYDFRDLTPMGRRGDEMIRRLADRLVAVDLLDQAAELLQHQVNKRLQGAARAQVAARLATILLMNNKPDRALATLRATHVAGFSTTLRNRRLLLEARALSDLGRPDVALEIIANVTGDQADRLRGDILWRARRWRKAAERIEATLGDRWRNWDPLNAIERNDVLRVGIGYTLSEDQLGLGRLRERYAARMADSPDSAAFDIVTGPGGPANAEFRAVASKVASVDTLDGFLRDMREGFSDLADQSSASPQGAPPSVPAAAGPASTTGQGAAAPAAADVARAAQ